ncbi:polysaccharide biosynthesis/export family protein [Apibacter raozihei]|uniref:polysaccharide biosynthesis/export family protein n=1 Tax=Apibacter raozihei TaxID=2500547 RepID=UPI000FE2D1C2|nr:polysaccharide biosynthesis/export family protein [Apibacter raozihei]
MMNSKFYILILLFSIFLTSCIGVKDLKYLQPSDNIQLNQYGLIPVSYENYRVKKDDILTMVLITTDENASKFLTSENTEVFKNATGSSMSRLKSGGLPVDPDGFISIYGLGEFYVYGLTLSEITNLVQTKLNQVLYNEGKAEVRINLGTIKYYMVGEVSSPGEKTEDSNRLDLLQAIAKAGDLTRYADRRHIRIIREYPEGKKNIVLDITRDDIMNSPYYYLQPGDQIIIDPLKEKISGLGGGTTIGDVTQFMSLGMSAITTYLFFKNL